MQVTIMTSYYFQFIICNFILSYFEIINILSFYDNSFPPFLKKINNIFNLPSDVTRILKLSIDDKNTRSFEQASIILLDNR